MNELEKKFHEAIKKAKFNFFEVRGFQAQPNLALLAGMAIGYKMAIDEFCKKED